MEEEEFIMPRKVIAQDLVKVIKSTARNELLTILAWGDEIELLGEKENFFEVKMPYYKQQADGSYKKVVEHGLIKRKTQLQDPGSNNILKVSFVDVQQGDGMVLETPKGRIVLIDGGENQLFARYLARRFSGSSEEKPLDVEAIVVTHGDADHFAGLSKIQDSEKLDKAHKRLFIRPRRIFHNGIVKGPSKKNGRAVKDDEMLGKTKQFENKKYLVELHDNLLDVDKDKLNKHFKAWVAAIRSWKRHGKNQDPIIIKRLQYGDDDIFSFLADEKIEVKVLGPFVRNIEGKPSLPLLHEPPKTPPIETEEEDITSEDPFVGNKNYSSSHTINGHSIVLQLKYGNLHYMFSGDLNQEAEIMLNELARENMIDLQSEVLKVPHHGSADFEPNFLKLVAPVISIISSGDETTRTEYIHPRATLVGSLGKYSRLQRPLVFVTELVAFFEKKGRAALVDSENRSDEFYSFERRQFGIVHIRSDGKRILVFTHSGKADMKEAYAFRLRENGKIEFDKVRT